MLGCRGHSRSVAWPHARLPRPQPKDGLANLFLRLGLIPARLGFSCSAGGLLIPSHRLSVRRVGRRERRGGVGMQSVKHWNWKRAVLALALVAAAGVFSSAQASPFPRPAGLEPAVAFWRNVFARWSEHQVAWHDNEHLDVVYEVVDLRDQVGPDGRAMARHTREREGRVSRSKARILSALEKAHQQGPDSKALSASERMIARKAAHLPGGRNRFRNAALRLRSQSGLRERFAAGLARRSGYLSRMQDIFEARGVPTGLADLPMVESCFDLEAYSRVGAAGTWQFMPATGRQYMQINSAIDERRDPLRATQAAAEHLAGDYASLGNWGLAITAYNHGAGGMRRAARETGTKDMGVIARRYKGRAFGFASRNFYAEFLAAGDVVRESGRYFGAIRHMPAPNTRDHRLPGATYARDFARRQGMTLEEMVAINPAILPAAVRGQARLPAGTLIRLPRTPDDLRVARTHLGEKSRRVVTDASRRVVHQVRPGQTLAAIARHYGRSVHAIQSANGVSRPQNLQVGARLVIPPNG